MINSSNSASTFLELIISEIEATPKEHWAELLYTLRQFRQQIPPTVSPVINEEQAKKNQQAINLLDSWLNEQQDENEHQQAWDFLKTALDEDRLSDRPLFS